MCTHRAVGQAAQRAPEASEAVAHFARLAHLVGVSFRVRLRARVRARVRVTLRVRVRVRVRVTARLAHEVRLCGGPVTVAPPCAAPAQRDLARVRVRVRMEVRLGLRVRVRLRDAAAQRDRAVAEALAGLEPELMLEEQLRDARPVQGEAQSVSSRPGRKSSSRPA